MSDFEFKHYVGSKSFHHGLDIESTEQIMEKSHLHECKDQLEKISSERCLRRKLSLFSTFQKIRDYPMPRTLYSI